jgi:1-acyl-sn-glycerol-3-phosphate acyltransferase
MIRKIVGLGLYFLGLGLWVILLTVGLFWIVPWLVLAYIAGYLSHVREWPEIRDFQVWRWLRNSYFKFRPTGEVLPNPDVEPFIYAIYPHGHFAITPLVFFALNPRFKSARPAVHSALFYIPVFSTMMKWLGAIPATRDAMLATLKEGKSIYMTPGGVADICNTGNTVKRRFGFLEVAKEAGVKVIPIWCPMERSYYTQYLPLGRTLESLFYFPIPMFLWGLWWFPFLPRAPPDGQDSPICVGKSSSYEEFWEEFERIQKI